MNNTLYYGDNLKIMQAKIEDKSVDLIYLDPPFNSQADYNVIFRDELGEAPPAQIKAFTDFWHWPEAVEEYERLIIEAPDRIRKVISGFYEFVGPNPLMAYLVMMTSRLLEMYRVLKPTGSLYLHCDPTASHYLKIILDIIFDKRNFQREIIWRIGWVSGFKTKAKNWVRNHDTILYYTKSDEFIFNKQYIPYKEGYKRRGEDDSPKDKPGIPIEDVWGISKEEKLTSIQIMSFSKEKLGYATQKPLALLERIIKASSNPGDIVFDPFCGCGTTIEAAEKLDRNWIGIDITYHAINLITKRLNDAFGGECDYSIIGLPEDYPSAQALATQDSYEFQWWALDLVGARPAGGVDDKKKGADKGIDGIYPFIDDMDRKSKIAIVSVKGGKTGPEHIRDLKGTVEREKAAMGILITLSPPTEAMRVEAATAGSYESEVFKKRYPKIQIISVKEYFEEGLRVKLPLHTGRSIAFKRAPRVIKKPDDSQNSLDV
ncbi:MAG: restriction endonuclease [candidate division Zixibacteria bacterium]|nr:restriction endonuclease [Candidatus Tariuqbacter arcticus]